MDHILNLFLLIHILICTFISEYNLILLVNLKKSKYIIRMKPAPSLIPYSNLQFYLYYYKYN